LRQSGAALHSLEFFLGQNEGKINVYNTVTSLRGGGTTTKQSHNTFAKMKYGENVYIITNQYNIVLYTGVTSLLRARIWEHKTKFYPKSFSAKYNCTKLVWFQIFPRIEEAIEREKQIKGGSSRDKEAIIKSINPTWKDLWADIQIYKII
jgi:putative endonuclease